MPGECCAVGRRADAAEIDAALRAGVPYRQVAAEASARGPEVSEPAMYRHRKHVAGEADQVKQEAKQDPPVATHARARIEPLWNSGEAAPKQVKQPTLSDMLEDVAPEPSFVDLPSSREGRVRAVMALMQCDRWVTGETGPTLAAHWGLSPSTLKEIAGEASRRVDAALDPVQVSRGIGSAYVRGIDLALAHAEADARALGPLAALLKGRAEFAGAGASQRLEVTGKGGAPLSLPPRAALLFEQARAGDRKAERLLREWAGGDEPDVPELVGEIVP